MYATVNPTQLRLVCSHPFQVADFGLARDLELKTRMETASYGETAAAGRVRCIADLPNV